jgi:serine phosphatase RsbU (regulator of sigma subunit)
MVTVNLLPWTKLRQHVASLKSVLAGGGAASVARGDVVVILPAMYTGNADWTVTPFGMMPGAGVFLAMINSVLTEQWLVAIPGEVLAIVLASLLGALMALRLAGRWFAAAAVAGVGTVVIGGLAAFALAGWIVPWLMPAAALALSGAAVYAERSRHAFIEHVRLETELGAARLIQETLIPRGTIEQPGLRIEARFRMASECGGDWWLHRAIDEHRHLVCIGDAVGHGVSAALIMVSAYANGRSIMEMLAAEGGAALQPSRFLKELNAAFCLTHGQHLHAGMSVAACIIDLAAGTLTFASAGHPMPFLVPTDEKDERIRANARAPYVALSTRFCNPIGHDPASTFQDARVRLAPGDRLVLYTDGVTERSSGTGKLFGTNRLHVAVQTAHERSLSDALDQILATVDAFASRAPAGDDATLVIAEIDRLGVTARKSR